MLNISPDMRIDPEKAAQIIDQLPPDQKRELSKDLDKLIFRQTNELWWNFRLTRPGDRTHTYRDWDGSQIHVPANDQLGFYMETCKIRAALGGNRGSKTQTGVKLVVDLALGVHPTLSEKYPAPNKGYVIAPKWEDNIKAVIIEKLKKFIPACYLRGGQWQKAWNEGERRLSFYNDSFIRFFTYEQDRNVLGGIDLDYFWMDEHGPKTHFMELMARIADKDGFAILTYTPEEGMTWEMEEIIEPSKTDPNIKTWFFPIFGNPHLNPDGVQSFADSIKDPMLRRVKLWGEPVLLAGGVLPTFNKAATVIPDRDIPKEWPRTFVIDPHDKTPHALLWMAWDEDDNCYVYRTIKQKGTPEEIATLIKVQSAGERIDLFLSDEANDGKMSDNRGNLSFNEDLRKFGIPVQPTGQKTEAAFKGGIYRLRDGFTCDPISGKPKIFIFASCDYGSGEYIDGKPQGSIVWEIERYRYKRETKADEETLREQIACIDDHFITDLRYGYFVGPMGRRGVNVDFGGGLYGE